MAHEQIRLDRTLSKFELGVAFILISVFVVWFLRRMSAVEALAEAQTLNLTIRNLQVGAMVYASTQLLDGKPGRITQALADSPVGKLITAPLGYIGAIKGVDPSYIRPGQWYYDLDKQELVYYIVNARFFRFHGKGPARVRIRLDLDYSDTNHNGSYDPGIDHPQGLHVKVLDKLDWTFKEGT